MKTGLKSKVTILHIEDNEADAELVGDYFKVAPRPSVYLRAKNAIESFQCLNKEGAFANSTRPDLILLDLNLGHISGFDILQKLKGEGEFRNIPVIIFTTSDRKEDIRRAYELGANAYIVKPYELAEVEAILKHIEQFWFGIAHL